MNTKGFRLVDVYDWDNKKPRTRAFMKRRLNKCFRQLGRKLCRIG